MVNLKLETAQQAWNFTLARTSWLEALAGVPGTAQPVPAALVRQAVFLLSDTDFMPPASVAQLIQAYLMLKFTQLPVRTEKVVALIQTDPSLSSELLKMANSVLYSARTPAETIHEATMRIGTRSLRSLVLSVSMRGAVFKGAGLAEYAQEVWRQAFSVGTICRAIAPRLAIEGS